MGYFLGMSSAIMNGVGTVTSVRPPSCRTESNKKLKQGRTTDEEDLSAGKLHPWVARGNIPG
jgi:hypothetical protein